MVPTSLRAVAVCRPSCGLTALSAISRRTGCRYSRRPRQKLHRHLQFELDKQADVSTKYASGDIILGPMIKRFGYTFTGYYYDREATKPVKLDAVAKSDVTVYAGWQKWDAETQKYMDMYQTLIDKGQYIMERPTAYEEKSFTRFYELAFVVYLRVGAGRHDIGQRHCKHCHQGARRDEAGGSGFGP